MIFKAQINKQTNNGIEASKRIPLSTRSTAEILCQPGKKSGNSVVIM